jgi:small subunit ribosomal protein S19e
VLQSTAYNMVDIRTIEPAKYNKELAQALKGVPEFKKPEWVDFVKSGSHKQRPILDSDFWYKRAASILRQIYVKKILGVQRLRTRYGGRKDRGMRPPIFRKSSGKIIRSLLQQAEAAGFVEKSKTKKAGRMLTVKGKEFLENFAK